MRPIRRAVLSLAAIACLAPVSAHADGELNLYSARHYDTDERLYSDFEDATGITINRIEDKADVLIERMKAEGRNSPADVFLAADAGVLYRAEEAGLLQPSDSEILNERIPAHLRHPEGKWYGFSQRARVIFYDKATIDPADVATYADLADPKLKGKVCTRSSTNVYMLSLLASRIEHVGRDAAKAWVQGLWDNRAREPQGGDTDQLRAIVSGECQVVLANTYYFGRAMRTDVRGLAHPEETDKIGVVFPDQDGEGAHVNISGGGIAANAPHPENAMKFLEYLASDSAQRYFADGNDEYPAVEGVESHSPIRQLGTFKADDLPLVVLGENQAEAQAIYNEVGYK